MCTTILKNIPWWLTLIQTTPNGSAADGSALGYDPFSMSNVGQSLQATHFNPYAQDHAGLAGAADPYYAAQSAYTAPLQPVRVAVLHLHRNQAFKLTLQPVALPLVLSCDAY
jgi:hypothetical protein